MTQDWEFRSTNLTTYAYNVQYLGAGFDVPGRRGENLVIPGKTGRYLTTSKPLDERRVSLSMWVKDVDPATGGSASEAQLLANLDALRGLFATGGTGLLKHTMGTVIRQAPAEVVSAVTFEPFGTAPYYRFVVEFVMADPLWRAQSATTAGPTGITTSPQNLTLANNGTYRNEQGTIQVTGQIVDPKFTIDADWVQYTGTVAAGGTLTIDCANWVATNGTVDVSGDISHEGDLVWLPIPTGTAVTLTVTGSNLGTALGGSPIITVSYLDAYI
jgi:hypothetical protein